MHKASLYKKKSLKFERSLYIIIIVVDAYHYTFSLAVRRSTGTDRPFSSVADAAVAVAAACA